MVPAVGAEPVDVRAHRTFRRRSGLPWRPAGFTHARDPVRAGHHFTGEISGFAFCAKALDHGEVLARFHLGVPEPATAVMALFGAVFLLATRRRARRAV